MSARIVVLLVALLLAAPLVDAQTPRLSVDATTFSTHTGGKALFNTTVENTGTAPTARLLLFLSIVDLSTGAPLDLEDWTAKRSFDQAPLAPGARATHAWELRAIIQGDYVVHVMALANGTSDGAITVGPPIHMHVDQATNLDPGGVLPIVAGVPALLCAALAGVYLARRRDART